jgi:hypothetical protein
MEGVVVLRIICAPFTSKKENKRADQGILAGRAANAFSGDAPFLMYHGITEDISHANDQVDVVLGA